MAGPREVRRFRSLVSRMLGLCGPTRRSGSEAHVGIAIWRHASWRCTCRLDNALRFRANGVGDVDTGWAPTIIG